MSKPKVYSCDLVIDGFLRSVPVVEASAYDTLKASCDELVEELKTIESSGCYHCSSGAHEALAKHEERMKERVKP